MSGVSIGITTRNWTKYVEENQIDDRSMVLEIQHLIQTGLERFEKVVLLLEQIYNMDQINTWLASALKELENNKNFHKIYLSSSLYLENIKEWLIQPQSTNNDENSEKTGLLSQPEKTALSLLIIKKPIRSRAHFSGLVARTFVALTSALNSGRANRVGLSGFRFGHIAELQRQLKNKKYPGLTAVQVNFSVLNRRAETTGLLLYCFRQRITVLASAPIPSDLVNLMLPLLVSPGNPCTPNTTEIHQTLSETKYNIKKSKLKLKFTPDTSEKLARSNRNSLLALALRAVADSRNLPWESIALNYVMEKGLIPLIESSQISKPLSQAVGWSLSQREITGLDRVSHTSMSLLDTSTKSCITLPNIFASPLKFFKSQFQKRPSLDDIESKIKHSIKETDVMVDITNPGSPLPSEPLKINISDLIPKNPNVDLNSNESHTSSPRHDLTSPLPNLSPRINIVLSPRMSNPGQQLSLTIRGSPNGALAWETNLDIQIIPSDTRALITADSSACNSAYNQSFHTVPPSLETLLLKDILLEENLDLETISESQYESSNVSKWKPILQQSISVSIPDHQADSIPTKTNLLLTTTNSDCSTEKIEHQGANSIFKSSQGVISNPDNYSLSIYTPSVKANHESHYFEFPSYNSYNSPNPLTSEASLTRSTIFKLDL